MDFSDLIQSFKSGTYAVTRANPASYGSDGRAVITTASTLNVDAAVFPVGGRDLERLPEGFRTKQMRAVVTVQELKTTSAAQEADVISIDGDAYQIQSVEPWSVLGNFWYSIALKVGN